MTIETLQKMALAAFSDNDFPTVSAISEVCEKLRIAFNFPEYKADELLHSVLEARMMRI